MLCCLASEPQSCTYYVHSWGFACLAPCLRRFYFEKSSLCRIAVCCVASQANPSHVRTMYTPGDSLAWRLAYDDSTSKNPHCVESPYAVLPRKRTPVMYVLCTLLGIRLLGALPTTILLRKIL